MKYFKAVIGCRKLELSIILMSYKIEVGIEKISISLFLPPSPLIIKKGVGLDTSLSPLAISYKKRGC